MYFSKIEDVQRLLRVIKRFFWYAPSVVLAGWQPGDSLIDPEAEPTGSVKEYALLVNGEAHVVALVLQNAEPLKSEPEAWIKRVFEGVGLPVHANMGGPTEVIKAKETLKEAYRQAAL